MSSSSSSYIIDNINFTKCHENYQKHNSWFFGVFVLFFFLNECRKLSVKEKGKKQVKVYFTTHSVLKNFVNETCVALHWCK